MTAIDPAMNGPARPVWASAVGHDVWGRWAELTVQQAVQRLRWIPAGAFCMGSPATELGRRQDETLRPVRVERPFWLAETTCHQALWRVVTGQSPSRFTGDDLPVEQVSWDEVTTRFLPEINRRVAGLKADLPDEVQWEYACRAGTSTAFHWGDASLSWAWAHHGGRPPRQTVPVKSFEPNAWGLYQMHGNVMEWCAQQPHEGDGGDGRVARGGAWSGPARTLRSACRVERSRSSARHDQGFRLAVPAG